MPFGIGTVLKTSLSLSFYGGNLTLPLTLLISYQIVAVY